MIENVGGSAGQSAQAGAAGGGGAPRDAGSGGTGGSSSTPVPGQNLLTDPSFETGTASWTCMGSCVVAQTNDDPHSGTSSLFVSGRTESWQGPARDIRTLVAAGTEYQIKAWVRQSTGDGAPVSGRSVSLSSKRHCADDVETFTPIVVGEVQADWVQLSGTFTAPRCELTELVVYIEGLAPEVDFYLDDVSLAAMP